MDAGQGAHVHGVDPAVMEFFWKGKITAGDRAGPGYPASVTNAMTSTSNELMYVKRISMEDAAVLRKMLSSGPPVWKLLICDMSLGAFKVAFDDLEACPWLKCAYFCIDCGGDDFGTNTFNALRSVESLGLLCRNIGSQFANDLASCIREGTSWEKLFLSNTCGGDEGVAVLTEAIVAKKGLKTLVLKHMNLSSESLISVAKMLAFNTTLERVTLNKVYPVDKNKVLALLAQEQYADIFKNLEMMWPEELLWELTMLIRREATYPRLTVKVTSSVDEGVLEEFFEAVAASKTIHWLCLNPGGQTSDAIAEGIASVVKRTRTIDGIINTTYVKRGDEHQLLCILDALKENHSITTFSMFTESMTPEIATSVSELLAVNDALRSLSIRVRSGNSASNVQTIIQGLKNNYTLTGLRLGRVSNTPEDVLEIKELLKRNRALTENAKRFVISGGDAEDEKGLDALMKVYSCPAFVQEMKHLTGKTTAAVEDELMGLLNLFSAYFQR